MKRYTVACLALLVVACGGSSPGDDSVGVDKTPPVMTVDAGPPTNDASAPDTSPKDDAGQPMSDDSGQPLNSPDSGSASDDAGPDADPDTGSAGDDSGSAVDSGTTSDDSGSQVADAGQDSGQDSGTQEDAGHPVVDSGPPPVCTNGQADCNGPSGAPRTCVEGQWQDDASCSGSTPVCLAGACVQCNPSAMMCSGTNQETCSSAGAWEITKTCPFVCSGSGVCSGTCVPGAMMCSGNQTEACGQNGEWGSPVSCPNVANASPTCSGAGVCGFTCSTGFGNCDGSAQNGCEADLNNSSDNCGTCGTSCCGAGTCSSGVCQPQQIVADTVQTFDMDSQYIYSVVGTTVLKTPKSGGTSQTLMTSAYASQLYTNGSDIFWGRTYLDGTTNAGLYSMPVGGGTVTTINNDGIQKTAFALDADNLFWSDSNNSGGPEIAWYATPSGPGGNTLASSSTAYVLGDMLSDGTNLYYTELYTPDPYQPCPANLVGSPESILKRMPVHGGTPMVGGLALPACGQYLNFAKDSTNFYYYEEDYSSSSTSTGIWSYPLAGTDGAATQILSKQGGPMASDGSNLYICYDQGSVQKMPVTGGAPQAITTTDTQSCGTGPVKLDNTCVYYTAYMGGVWTVNK